MKNKKDGDYMFSFKYNHTNMLYYKCSIKSPKP